MDKVKTVKCIIITNKNSWVSASIIKILEQSDQTELASVVFFDAAGNWNLIKKRFNQYGILKFTGKLKIIIKNKLSIFLQAKVSSNTTPSTSFQLVKQKKINHLITSNLNDNKTIEYINVLKPDVVFVFSCSQILSQSFLKNRDIKFINFHDSLLPAHKGPSPSFWVLFNQEKVSGYTIHSIVPKIDSGEILYQEKITVDAGISEEELIKKIVKHAGTKIVELLIKINQNIKIEFEHIRTKPSYEGIPNQADRKHLKRNKQKLDEKYRNN